MEISPQMKYVFDNPNAIRQKKHVFPFDTMNVYETFRVGMDKITLAVLRTTAARAGKRLGRRFRVVALLSESAFEVGRIPDAEGAMPEVKAVKVQEPDKPDMKNGCTPDQAGYYMVQPIPEPEEPPTVQRIKPMWVRD